MEFTEQFIEAFVLQHYRLTVKAKALNGYDELNFLLKGEDGLRYILKVATDEHGYHFLDAQVKIVNHLSGSEVGNRFQHYLLNTAGKELTTLIIDDTNYYLRILSFLEGDFWVDTINRTDALHADLGDFLGRMDKALQNFSHPAMHRHYTWDISTAMDANAKIHCITNHEQRRIAGYFLLQFETEVLPVLASLRHAYAHNDANDYNLLVKDNAVSGLIDFGDMVYTALINNVAVACTYAMLNNKKPLDTAALVVKNYHAIYPLTVQELDLL
jgi:Ser/Thr protein kinase RdoA (MazF antagonist)